MPRRPRSFLADTDLFIDYLNGLAQARAILDSPFFRIYYSVVTRKELLRKPGLSATERQRIALLLARHRLIAVDRAIAARYGRLMTRYRKRDLRPADALVAATAWAKALPLLTRNLRHYRFLSEIKVVSPTDLIHTKSIAR